MKRSALLLLLSFTLVTACTKKTAPEPTPVPVNDPLLKGINLSNWFNDYSDPAQYANRFTTITLQLIRSKGFTYVRIPIGATLLFDKSNPSSLKPGNLAALDAAVNNCINAGLAVTINLHPLTNDTDSLLSHDAGFVNKLSTYWNAVAAYFKKYPAAKLFFEVYNEPHASAGGITTESFSWWQPVQGKLIAAIRAATTEHYIIAGGEGWNSIDGLLKLQPYSDAKLIYNFHFYDPFLFTHQGADWSGWEPAMQARNVPYPSSPAAVAPLINAGNSNSLNDALQWYGYHQYNIDSLDRWIKRAYDWGKANNVKIIANEFGSYKMYSPRQSRLNWIHDTRMVFEKYKIGWCMWECDEGFGWINYTGDNRNNPVADAEVLAALGL